ncbi:MAG: OmpA family protein, partial [Pseudomonadota bacterium]
MGHTDSVGSLENNIALSRRRAESVRARLIDVH